MPPKALPEKNVPTKNPPPKASQQKNTSGKGAKGRTGKKVKEKPKRHVLNLKGWLETKADWEKFDAWAKINAEPRKIPEPEPLVRPSKPLSKMKKRIVVLSRPPKRPDASKLCRFDIMSVSKKALKARPSKRILQLSKFILREIESCREVPVQVPHTALQYKPTQRIIEISQPLGQHFSEYCKFLATSQDSAPSKKMTDRMKRLALAKKAVECPHLMTNEEIDFLMTPMGVYRSALTYEVTPWMNYLALPAYRYIKEQKDEKAEEWKKVIVDEGDVRGKKALEYKKKQAERAKKRKEDTKRLEEKEAIAEAEEDKKPSEANAEEDKDNEKEDVAPEEVPEEQADEPEGGAGDGAQDSTTNDEENNEESARAKQKAGDTETQKEETAEEAEAAKQRRAERNAWRFAPPPYADNPFELKRSALKGTASPRVTELAKHQIRKDRTYKHKPYDVRKSALTGPVPERMVQLANPRNPRDPVERPPPREKDAYGRPIFPKQPYGKKMPRMKPYQEAECPKKDDDEGQKEEKSEET